MQWASPVIIINHQRNIKYNMSVKEAIEKLGTIEDKEARLYTFTDNGDQMDAELASIEAREIVPFKPFWTNVNGYLIQ